MWQVGRALSAMLRNCAQCHRRMAGAQLVTTQLRRARAIEGCQTIVFVAQCVVCLGDLGILLQVSALLQRDLSKVVVDTAREQARAAVNATVNAVAPAVASAVAASLQQELASAAGARLRKFAVDIWAEQLTARTATFILPVWE